MNSSSQNSPAEIAEAFNAYFANIGPWMSLKMNEKRNLDVWLMANKLSLKIGKTKFMLIGSHQRPRRQNNQQIDIHIEGNSISQAERKKSSGVFIDDKLTLKEHVDEISKKPSSGIGDLRRLRPFIPLDR